jgi:hypothetical protein
MGINLLDRVQQSAPKPLSGAPKARPQAEMKMRHHFAVTLGRVPDSLQQPDRQCRKKSPPPGWLAFWSEPMAARCSMPRGSGQYYVGSVFGLYDDGAGTGG